MKRTEPKEKTEEALESLQREPREVIRLHYDENLSLKDIAKQSGRNLSMIRTTRQ